MDYLQSVKSRLVDHFTDTPFAEILNLMDLYTGPKERRMLKNVAAMMFSQNPAKFFPVTQVDIVIFPEGCINNLNNMIEVPKIVGPVAEMIKQTLNYIKTNVIKKQILKQKDKAESITYFNYPYQAIEEAVVNALYHRDYQEREPVEITIEPDNISILSYAGPDRSISWDAIQKAESLKSRRYRNRRLGDYLKELELSEGRATGIPTIQDELRKNGSELAKIETDEDRTYFLIEIPCHEGFEKAIEPLNEPLNDTELQIIKAISTKQIINRKQLVGLTGLSAATITRSIAILSSAPFDYIERQGSKKTGGYVLTENGKYYIKTLNTE